MRHKLSIVIPVFNNEKTLPHLLDALDNVRQDLSAHDTALQVIFVDDGSRDGSYSLLAQRHFKKGDISVYKLTRNFGAIGALKSILDRVTGDAFLFLAADLQDPPDLISQMVELWIKGSKYVIARRKQRVDSTAANVNAGLFYWFLRKYVVKNYPRHGFDLALMDRQFLPYLANTGKHVNFPLYPFWLGFEPTYIDYERQIFIRKKSSWTFAKKLNLAVNSLLSFSRAPTRLLFIGGTAISLLSFLYAVFIVVSALLGRVEVPGFATIIALTSILQGVTIFFLGIISEYVWRIFDEVNGHPSAVVDVELKSSEE